GGGTVMVPAGVFAVHNITIPSGVILRGQGRGATILQSWHTEQTFIISLPGTHGGMADLSVFGKGSNADATTLGAVNPVVLVGGVENVLERLLVLGGGFSIYATGNDNSFYDVNASQSYSSANVATIGANWYIRCKFDQGAVSVNVTDAIPFANWTAGTVYTAGQARIVGGYALACTVSGTSAVAPPTVKNYGVNIADGTATWQLLAPATYADFLLGTGRKPFYRV
ncbi:MAG: hypothetical protein JWO19_6105, partial [Bryobacterales bacterium]|nr:hypothetical protein [Bryobacterales bacterium]